VCQRAGPERAGRKRIRPSARRCPRPLHARKMVGTGRSPRWISQHLLRGRRASGLRPRAHPIPLPESWIDCSGRRHNCTVGRRSSELDMGLR
jgi:hypothetical protein